MTLVERLFALRGVPGFDQLRDGELLAVAAGMTVRRYAPGEVVLAAGATLWSLIVTIEGRLVTAGTARVLPAVVGADLLLTNRPLPHTLTADPLDGAVCLRLGRGHFFTVVNECPAFLVEIARLYVGDAAAAETR